MQQLFKTRIYFKNQKKAELFKTQLSSLIRKSWIEEWSRVWPWIRCRSMRAVEVLCFYYACDRIWWNHVDCLRPISWPVPTFVFLAWSQLPASLFEYSWWDTQCRVVRIRSSWPDSVCFALGVPSKGLCITPFQSVLWGTRSWAALNLRGQGQVQTPHHHSDDGYQGHNTKCCCYCYIREVRPQLNQSGTEICTNQLAPQRCPHLQDSF